VANLSVEIASKLLGKKLQQTGEQAKLIDNYLKDIDFSKN
jgi:F0F1-type ATP synthase membrane subunit b/b'